MIDETLQPRITSPGRAEPATSRRVALRRASDRRNQKTRKHLLARVRAEFTEMPGQCLTLPQAARLFGVPPDVCGRLLDRLASEGLLRRNTEGRYCSTSTGAQ